MRAKYVVALVVGLLLSPLVRAERFRIAGADNVFGEAVFGLTDFPDKRTSFTIAGIFSTDGQSISFESGTLRATYGILDGHSDVQLNISAIVDLANVTLDLNPWPGENLWRTEDINLPLQVSGTYRSFDFVRPYSGTMVSNAGMNFFLDFSDYPNSIVIDGGANDLGNWFSPDIVLEPQFYLEDVTFDPAAKQSGQPLTIANRIPPASSVECPCCDCADFNGDGVIGLADYTLWRDTLGQTVDAYSGADGSGNGAIDAADYALWKSQFGEAISASTNAAANVAVPEPATILLVSISLLGMLQRFGPVAWK